MNLLRLGLVRAYNLYYRNFNVCWDQWALRCTNVLNDPDNAHLERHPEAGQVKDGVCTMHCGVRVYTEYYNQGHFDIVIKNRGVHEPQEERAFQEVLKDVPAGGTMIELGSYWSFYSLWFASAIKNARNIMVEPRAENIELGRRNFALNGRTGTFHHALVSDRSRPGNPPTLCVDDLMDQESISNLDILHSDIQGAEVDMLGGAARSLRARKIRYIFISTHSNRKHYECREILRNYGYRILASADLFESYCFDGVLVAEAPVGTSIQPIAISNRRREAN